MIFKHILFPVDFSAQTRAVQDDVEWLARRFGSQVTLLHVAQVSDGWCELSGVEFLGNILSPFDYGAKQNLDDYRIDVPEDRLTRIIARGSVAWDIADCASKHDVDLVVMGTHGYGTVKRFLVGSILQDVLHGVTCPVWIRSTHESGSTRDTAGVANILCAVEITEEAFPLLQFARRVADAFGANVTLLHSQPEANLTEGTQADPARWVDALVGDEILSLQRQAGTDFSVLVTTEPVPTAVIRAARDYKADLVLIGRGVGRHWLDTHEYDIIRHASCPVLSYSLREKCEITLHLAPELANAAGEI
jgi:nucleotide-binding universal stress UspA family protein